MYDQSSGPNIKYVNAWFHYALEYCDTRLTATGINVSATVYLAKFSWQCPMARYCQCRYGQVELDATCPCSVNSVTVHGHLLPTCPNSVTIRAGLGHVL